jgi:DNA-binding SARP family transcriptional activator
MGAACLTATTHLPFVAYRPVKEQAMSSIRFFLFGKLRIEIEGTETCKIEPRKAEELLVFLLLHRSQPQSRERLADLLWREGVQDQANNYLRKALWQLQSALDQLGLSQEGLLLIDGEWLQVNPQFDLWLDIAVFEETFKKSQGVSGRDLEESQAQSIQFAVEAYRGDLLDGWYQDWCLYERERLQYLYLAMLDKLMDYCEARGAYEDGLVFGQRILHHDQARERTHRRLMRLYYMAGDRTAALRQYQKCVAALKEELDVAPADRTRLLYELIRADQMETPLPPTLAGTTGSRKIDEPLQMLFNHLSILHKSLSQIQTQIAQDLEVIQKTIKNNHT